jgi:hypothetical protein
MGIKYKKILHSRALKKITQIWIFDFKMNHLATLFLSMSAEACKVEIVRISLRNRRATFALPTLTVNFRFFRGKFGEKTRQQKVLLLKSVRKHKKESIS